MERKFKLKKTCETCLNRGQVVINNEVALVCRNKRDECNRPMSVEKNHKCSSYLPRKTDEEVLAMIKGFRVNNRGVKGT